MSGEREPSGQQGASAAAGRRFSGTIRGSLLMLVFTVAISGMHGVVRFVSAEIHPFEVAFFRSLVGLAVVMPVLITSGPGLLRTERPALHICRGLLNVGAILCLFTGLSLTPLAYATALNFTYPVFAALAAVLFLGEPFRRDRMLALAFAFAGVLVMLQPGRLEVGLGPALVLLSAALWAATVTATKAITRTDSSATVLIYAGIIMVAATLLPAAAVWQWPSPAQLALLLAVGLLSGVAQWTLTQALKEAEMTAVLPLDYLRMIWAAALGFALFGEVPTLWVWAGSALVFAAATFVSVRGR